MTEEQSSSVTDDDAVTVFPRDGKPEGISDAAWAAKPRIIYCLADLDDLEQRIREGIADRVQRMEAPTHFEYCQSVGWDEAVSAVAFAIRGHS